MQSFQFLVSIWKKRNKPPPSIRSKCHSDQAQSDRLRCLHEGFSVRLRLVKIFALVGLLTLDVTSLCFWGCCSCTCKAHFLWQGIPKQLKTANTWYWFVVDDNKTIITLSMQSVWDVVNLKYLIITALSLYHYRSLSVGSTGVIIFNYKHYELLYLLKTKRNIKDQCIFQYTVVLSILAAHVRSLWSNCWLGCFQWQVLF